MKLGINGLGRIGKLSLWHHVGRKYFSEIIINLGRPVGKGLEDIAASIEKGSEHSLAEAIVTHAENQKVKTNFATTKAKVSKWTEYRKGRLLIGRATIIDETDQINCVWFNNKFPKNILL